MRYYLILILMVLAGCASAPVEDKYAECVLPVIRDAGLGVKVNGCHAWEFKPTRTQQANFGKQNLSVR